MSDNYVITIGRQYGSGGRLIGRKLADALGFSFYDKELITVAAKRSGINEKIFESVDEHPTNSLLYSLAMGTYNFESAYIPYSNMSIPLSEQVFQMQSSLIAEFADKGPCVFVGRCADYVLRDNPRCINIFIKAEPAERAERLVKYYGVEPAKVKDVMRKADKMRANYYKTRTGRAWASLDTYDLCIDSGKLGVDKTADILLDYIRARMQAG